MGYVLLGTADRQIVAYEFKGEEKWKQNLGGQSKLLELSN